MVNSVDLDGQRSGDCHSRLQFLVPVEILIAPARWHNTFLYNTVNTYRKRIIVVLICLMHRFFLFLFFNNMLLFFPGFY